MNAFTNCLAGRVALLRRAPLAVLADDFRFADQLHAFADEFHRQRVVAHANALIVGHEVPALQCVAGDLGRVGPGDVAREPHRRLLQADADQLHAVVGFDHDLGEVRLGRNAADRDHLHAEPIAQVFDDELLLIRGWPAGCPGRAGTGASATGLPRSDRSSNR